MPAAPLSDELAREAADAYRAAGCVTAHAARALNIPTQTMQNRLKRAAERGMLLDVPAAMPGFTVSKVTDTPKGQSVEQRPEHGAPFEVPPGHIVKGVSTLVDADGRKIIEWVKTKEDAALQEAAMRAVVDALKEEIPRIEPTPPPAHGNPDLLNQFTVTDLHFGMLAWREETGADYDLRIAEKLLLDWFAAAIRAAPSAETAVFAQLGDLLHYDSFLSITPTHGHILDSDSRFPKMVRVVIRTLRRVISMLLASHQNVHVIMADGNHDPAGGVWLREMFAAAFEDEPRIHVDNSASTYYMLEHGDTSLFYHHGHKRNIGNVDTVFAGKFRETYGRTRHSYAHIGHLHSDELKSTNLMKVERHATLAAPDAYAANGGWLAGRSAKVITYHKKFGEVGRIILSPEMVAT